MSRRYLGIISVIIFLLLIFTMYTSKPILRWIFPIRYTEDIAEQSDLYELDPFMIAAVIQVESKWRPKAISPKGATGLMQLMPDTGKWIANQIELDNNDLDLTDPVISIKLGSWYLSYLQEQFPTILAALAAYNGGQGNVRNWLKQTRWNGSLDTVNEIPFYETRTYLKRVLYIWDFYKNIYDHNFDEAKGVN